VGEAVIVVRGLRKSYGSLQAVQGIDLEVERGEIFAFLGPNGAGKTTTVEILEGYRHRSGGEVAVLGVDPSRATPQWRSRVGVVLQECRLPSLLTVREALEMYAGYYPAPRSVPETIALVGLSEQADQRAGKLSGGQQRRLDVALALIGDPELLFLDEPTTGFDPAARREAWHMITNLRRLGKTVFLTTHYMDEAQNLADRVAIIKAGRIVAEGRPGELGSAGRRVTVVRFLLPPGLSGADLPGDLAGRAVEQEGQVVLSTESPVRDLADLCGWALAGNVELSALEVHRPTLEDVYLELTVEERADAS
jgi:ABC-2 type transport system ATP-binding protein